MNHKVKRILHVGFNVILIMVEYNVMHKYDILDEDAIMTRVQSVREFITSHKKKLILLIIAIVIILILIGVGKYMLHIKGTVTQIDGSKITVTSHISTRTVDLTGTVFANTPIQLGDKICIEKNFSGNVCEIDINNKHRREHIKGKNQ